MVAERMAVSECSSRFFLQYLYNSPVRVSASSGQKWHYICGPGRRFSEYRLLLHEPGNLIFVTHINAEGEDLVSTYNGENRTLLRGGLSLVGVKVMVQELIKKMETQARSERSTHSSLPQRACFWGSGQVAMTHTDCAFGAEGMRLSPEQHLLK